MQVNAAGGRCIATAKVLHPALSSDPRRSTTKTKQPMLKECNNLSSEFILEDPLNLPFFPALKLRESSHSSRLQSLPTGVYFDGSSG